MIKRGIIAALAALASAMPNGAQTLTIVSSTYGVVGGARADITATLRTRCDGRTSCSGRVGQAALGIPDPAPNVIKYLEIRYRCGSQSSASLFTEYLDWRITCPFSSHPQAMAELRLVKKSSCDSRENTEQALLPDGYRYCWHRLFDFSKAGDSGSSAARTSSGGREGVAVKWRAKPGGFPCPLVGGHGWLDHQWLVAGARSGEACPPVP